MTRYAVAVPTTSTSERTRSSSAAGSPSARLCRLVTREICPRRDAAAFIVAGTLVSELLAECWELGVPSGPVLHALADHPTPELHAVALAMHARVVDEVRLSEPQRRKLCRDVYRATGLL